MKSFVLDTNVLLHDPQALFAFDDNEVVVPIYVIEEIDKFKRDVSELGRAARTVGRHLDKLRSDGKLVEGVTLDHGGTLRVAFSSRALPNELTNSHLYDNKILAVALDVRDSNNGRRTVLVTKDVNLRIRADVLGVEAEDYDVERVELDELYGGMVEVDFTAPEIDLFYGQGWLPIPDPYYYPSEFVHLRDPSNPAHSALGKVSLADERLVPIKRFKDGVWGVRPRNKEQSFAFDLLMNDDIKLVTLVGKAGTGKTLLAIAAGLQKTAEEGVYQRILVSRPVMPLGRDIGFLPGDIEEKVSPWMQPIYDNLDYLMNQNKPEKDRDKRGRSSRELIDLGIIQVEPLTYIRGRSIPNQFLIVDEAQNLTPHEVKTIVTRVADGTKIILTGDPYQIDNPYIDSTNNGLVHVVNRMKGEAIAGHVTLVKGERSALAELASNLL